MHVYLIQNLVNGKCYVGKHVGDNLELYLKLNVGRAICGEDRKPFLYNAIRKYGKNSFTLRSIHKTDNEEDLNNAEKAYIKFFGTMNPELGYNLTAGGEGVLGLIRSSETRKKMSLAHKGKSNSATHNANITKGNLGRIVSQATRDKMRIAQSVRTLSEEANLKMLAGMFKKGHTFSKPSLEKMRKAKLGKKGPVASEETRSKIKASVLAYWDKKKQEKLNGIDRI